MFLPMSCTSPLTVASTILPFDEVCARPSRSCSMNGIRWATACFITRADLTTCGRNIRPEPNRSPTTFMPSISGPSITASGRGAFLRASSTSSAMKSVMPWTSACARRFSTGHSRQERSASFFSLPGPRCCCGNRQQPLGRVGAAIEHHVLAGFAQLRIEVVIDRHLAGIDDAHVHSGRDGVIEKHRVHRLAHRFVAAERERQVRDAARHMRMRQVLPDPARPFDEVDPVAVVLLHPGRDREDVRIEDDVLRRKADAIDQDVVGARGDRLSCAPSVSACPASSNAMTTTAAP